jgi:hypothetical protein
MVVIDRFIVDPMLYYLKWKPPEGGTEGMVDTILTSRSGPLKIHISRLQDCFCGAVSRSLSLLGYGV